MRDSRLTASERGYGYRWQQARIEWLAKHPCCVMCQQRGLVVPASVVDHIEPPRLAEAKLSGCQEAVREALRLFWNRRNWQSLCKRCHDSVKQAQESSGKVSGCGLDGVPLDAGHHWRQGGGG